MATGTAALRTRSRLDTGRPRLLAYIYLAEILVLGACALVWGLLSFSTNSGNWSTFAVLALCATVAQRFAVVSASQQAFRPAIVFLVAGALLLRPDQISLLIIIAFAAEWLWDRRSWRWRVLDLAAFAIAAQAAGFAYHWVVANEPYPQMPAHEVLAPVMAAIIMACVTRLLAWGHVVLVERLPAQRMASLTNEAVLTDIVLAIMGVAMALLWHVDSWLMLFMLPPLVLIRRSLRLPKLEEEVTLEPKTGLLNARAFQQLGQRELERHSRLGRSLAIVMADLDFLREINNSYGHLAGDIVLQRVAQIIRASIRDRDLACRFGGEEFCILLPAADAREGMGVAERIRQAVEQERFHVPTSDEPLSVTISLGIATYPYNGDDLQTVLHEADLAVYRAKMNGRNRVCIAMLDASGTGLRAPEPGAQAVHGQARGDQPHGTVDEAILKRLATAVRPAPSREHARRKRFGVAFKTAVVLCAPLLTAIAWAAQPTLPPIEGLLLLVAFAIVAELLAVDIYSQAKASSVFVPLLAGLLLYGVPALLAIAVALGILAVVRRRARRRQAFFQSSVMLLAGLAAFYVYSAFGQPLSLSHLPYLILPAAGASVVYYLLSTLLVAQAVGLEQGRGTMTVWRELFQWLAPHYLLLAALAVLLAATYQAFGPLVLLAFAVPTLSMRLAYKQYAERTATSVQEMHKANTHCA